jgi:NAD(P)-dependent dehydrogenase (short-subunit alcohol dehydrogenase family)
MSSTWLITGCSTGLGRAFAAEVLGRGQNAVVTARNPTAVRDLVDAHPETALGVARDVTDPTQVTDAVDQALQRFGRIYVLVNNAGYGYRAAVEEAADGDVRRLFDTNLYGAVAMIRAVLPGMRARHAGTIVNVSSIGARTCPPGSGYYSATKVALEAMTSALRKEIQPLGLTAMVVEPGAFRTDFAGRSLTQSAEAIADYAETAVKRRKENDTVHGTQPGDPARAAAALVDVVSSGEAPELLVLGSDALDGFRSVLDGQRAEVEAWEHVSTSTGFERS